MRIAVSGATGFVGSHLIDRLVTNGHEPAVLVRRSADAAPFSSRDIRVVAGDVTDAASVRNVVAGSDVVVNLARAKAHTSHPPAVVTSVNVNGARIVAREAARAGARLIHASSTAVYGSRISSIPASESAPLRPDTAYAASKVEGENAVMTECSNAVVLRISGILGPRCLSWLSLFRSARDGTLPIVGDGSNVHHPVDVDDVVNAIMLCIEQRDSTGTFNIAGPASLTVCEMVRLMARATGSERSPRKVPRAIVTGYSVAGRLMARVGVALPRTESVLFLNGNRSFDLSRARSSIGFRPDIQPPQAIERTASWYKSEGLI